MGPPEDEALLRDMLDHARRAVAAVSGKKRADLDSDFILAAALEEVHRSHRRGGKQDLADNTGQSHADSLARDRRDAKPPGSRLRVGGPRHRLGCGRRRSDSRRWRPRKTACRRIGGRVEPCHLPPRFVYTARQRASNTLRQRGRVRPAALGASRRAGTATHRHCRRRHRDYAAATFRKDQRVNVRISSRDLDALRKRALSEVIPYQTLIASVLHRFVEGQLRVAETPD